MREDLWHTPMNSRDKSIFLAALLLGRSQFMDSLSCLSDEAVRRRPAPKSWSILECLEHVVVTEREFLHSIQTAEPLAAPRVNKLRESAILAYGINRDQAVQAPEELWPTGRFASLAEAVQAFLECRAATVNFVRNCDQNLMAMQTRHSMMGSMSAHEMLLMVSCHADRHRCQIFAVRKHVCDWLSALMPLPQTEEPSPEPAVAAARCA